MKYFFHINNKISADFNVITFQKLARMDKNQNKRRYIDLYSRVCRKPKFLKFISR